MTHVGHVNTNLPGAWEWLDFNQVFRHLKNAHGRLYKRDYQQRGRFPVIDQGRVEIGGYTDEQALVHRQPLPVILFGDHTRCVKYVDYPFVVGAEGLKILAPMQHPRYCYWLARALELPDRGYERHYKYLRAARFPMAPIREQSRIADAIDNAVARLNSVRAMISDVSAGIGRLSRVTSAATLSGVVTAAWRQRSPVHETATAMLRRLGLNASAVPTEMPGGVPELPEGWTWVRLSDVVHRIESGVSPRAENRPARDHEYGVLKISALSTGQFLAEQNKTLQRPPDARHLVHRDDLLLARANTSALVGSVALVREAHHNLALSDKTLRLVPAHAEVSREYLMHGLRAPWVRRWFEQRASGSSRSMRNLTQKDIKATPIVWAPPAEQRRLVAILNRVDEELHVQRTHCRQLSLELARLEQGLLTRTFQGGLFRR